MKKLSFVLIVLLLGTASAFAQLDPWQFPLSQYGVSPGVTYGSVAPSVATIGRPPAPGEIWIDTNGAPDGGAAMFIYNATAGAFESAGSSIGVGEVITFEGATADAVQTILSVVDPTVGTGTFLLPNNAAVAANYALIFSTLGTNALDAANSVWFASNQIVLESTVADAFQYTIQPAALTGSVALTLPSDNGDWAGTAAPMYSVLLTNAPDAANSVWGVSNGIHWEGTTPDDWENSLQSADLGQDQVNYMGDYGEAAMSTIVTLLDNMDLDDSYSTWFNVTGGLVSEGLTADDWETTLNVVDPTLADQTYSAPDMGAAVTAKLLHVGPVAEPAFDTEIIANASSDTVYHHVFEKHWFRAAAQQNFHLTAGTAWSTTGEPNFFDHEGQVFEVDMKGTVAAPDVLWAVAEGITNPVLDAENEGIEITRGITAASPSMFVIDTDQAFYFRVAATITTVAQTDAFEIGFRTVEAYQNADPEGYDSFAVIGVGDHGNGGPGDIYTHTANGAATTSTDIGEADWAGGEIHVLEVRIAADGTTTYEYDGGAATGAAAFDFATQNVIPYIWIQSDDTGGDPVIYIHYWEVGFGQGS